MPFSRSFPTRLAVLALTSLCLGSPGLGRAETVVPQAPPTGPAPAPAPGHDCNGNGIEDAVDIALGTSCDADLDGVPDECQAAAAFLPGSSVDLPEGTSSAPGGS